MDKLISQQAAINVVSEITTTMSVCTNKDECYGMKRMQKQALTELENLPSIQPDTTTHDSIPAETDKNDGDGTSGDCISRAQAIDALRKMQTYKLFSGDDMLLIDQAEAQTELMMLPSIQPEPEAISEWKKEFREYVDSLDIKRDDWKGIIEYIDELPSAQPEIIYCKDCKWCVEHYDTDGNVPYWICKNWDAGTDADGFCHEAERREDE